MIESQPKSTFVTVVAWIFIALSGFTTMISVLQNVLIQTMFRRPEVSQALADPPPGAPPFAAFMMTHFQWFFLGFLVVSAFTLLSSIGLLRRWNWARLCFIGLMMFGIAWQFAGVGLQILMMSATQQQFSELRAHGGPDMGVFFYAISVFSALMAIAFSVLFGWIIRRLVAAPIVAEFRR